MRRRTCTKQSSVALPCIADQRRAFAWRRGRLARFGGAAFARASSSSPKRSIELDPSCGFNERLLMFHASPQQQTHRHHASRPHLSCTSAASHRAPRISRAAAPPLEAMSVVEDDSKLEKLKLAPNAEMQEDAPLTAEEEKHLAEAIVAKLRAPASPPGDVPRARRAHATPRRNARRHTCLARAARAAPRLTATPPQDGPGEDHGGPGRDEPHPHLPRHDHEQQGHDEGEGGRGRRDVPAHRRLGARERRRPDEEAQGRGRAERGHEHAHRRPGLLRPPGLGRAPRRHRGRRRPPGESRRGETHPRGAASCDDFREMSTGKTKRHRHRHAR